MRSMTSARACGLGRERRQSRELPGLANRNRESPWTLPQPARQANPKAATAGNRLFLELWIDLHLISRHHLVRLIRHTHDCHQLFEHRIGHAFLLCGNSV